MAELVNASGVYYVLDLMITPPELPMSDDWVNSTGLGIESCMLNMVHQ